MPIDGASCIAISNAATSSLTKTARPRDPNLRYQDASAVQLDLDACRTQALTTLLLRHLDDRGMPTPVSCRLFECVSQPQHFDLLTMSADNLDSDR